MQNPVRNHTDYWRNRAAPHLEAMEPNVNKNFMGNWCFITGWYMCQIDKEGTGKRALDIVDFLNLTGGTI
jgi:hypothetical protein